VRQDVARTAEEVARQPLAERVRDVEKVVVVINGTRLVVTAEERALDRLGIGLERRDDVAEEVTRGADVDVAAHALDGVANLLPDLRIHLARPTGDEHVADPPDEIRRADEVARVPRRVRCPAGWSTDDLAGVDES